MYSSNATSEVAAGAERGHGRAMLQPVFRHAAHMLLISAVTHEEELLTVQ